MRDKLQSEELQSAHRHARPVSLQLSSSLRASHWYTLPYVCMYMCVYLYACTCHSLPAIKPSNHRIHFYVRHLLITTTHTFTSSVFILFNSIYSISIHHLEPCLRLRFSSLIHQFREMNFIANKCFSVVVHMTNKELKTVLEN